MDSFQRRESMKVLHRDIDTAVFCIVTSFCAMLMLAL